MWTMKGLCLRLAWLCRAGSAQQSPESQGTHQLLGIRHVSHTKTKRIAGLLQAVFDGVLMDKERRRGLCNIGALSPADRPPEYQGHPLRPDREKSLSAGTYTARFRILHLPLSVCTLSRT